MTFQYFNLRRVSSGPVPCRPSSSALTAGSYLRAKHQNKYSKDVTLAFRHLVAIGRSMQLKVVAFRDAKERTAAAAPRPSRSMSVSEYFSIDIDNYRLLQVPRVSRPDAIRKAYETLLKQPPATAYSADTLFSRAVLLKSVTESLVDPDLRRSYDAKLSAGLSALRVSPQDLPGALVVLQEIGKFELVLEHGVRWLELNGGQPDAGDVAAAVALAYCDRAGEHLAIPGNPGAVMQACDDLEGALVQLRRYGMAKQLQTQIVGALQDLTPDYACELAALPLSPDTAARRAKGVNLMREVLRSATAAVATVKTHDSSRGSFSNSALMLDGGPSGLFGADADCQSVVGHARRMLQRSRDILTCGEQVFLMPDALRGSGVTPHPDVLYDSALACIVDGYRNGWPHSIQEADQLLQRLEEHVRRQAADEREKFRLPAAATDVRLVQYNGGAVPQYDEVSSNNGDGGGDGPQTGTVALERAVCAVLLGDYAAAAALLGLVNSGLSGSGGDGSAEGAEAMPKADAQLRNFVMEHAPKGTQDMRPGLRAFATKWLAGVALASFRDTAEQPATPLETHWFAEPRVAAYLQVWSVWCRNEHVLEATHCLCNLLPNAMNLLGPLAVKAATVVALTTTLVQRLCEALAALAATAVFSKQQADFGTASAHGGRSNQQQITKGRDECTPQVRQRLQGGVPGGSGGVPAVYAETLPPVDVAATVLATAATPLGYPYGKPLHSGAVTKTIASVDDSTDMMLKMRATANTTSIASHDLRRRFAASAAVDATERRPAQLGDSAGAAHSDFDSQDCHEDAVVDAQQTDVAAEEDELDGAASAPQRGMTEQELRAHLAGLEVAMWDSELPGRSPKRLVMAVIGVASTIAALFFFMLRRDDGGLANARAPVISTTPAIVSITVSTFALWPK